MPSDPTSPDVEPLIELSRPTAAPALGVMSLLLIAAGTIALIALGQDLSLGMRVLASVVMLGVMLLLLLMPYRIARQLHAEQQSLRAAEAAVLLRHWPEAWSRLAAMLTQPMRTQIIRRGALGLMAVVLDRYGYREKSIQLLNELARDPTPGEPDAFTVAVARANVLLADDRLWDADDAITRLRRGVDRGLEAMRAAVAEQNDADTPPVPKVAAVLELVELYRALKTGRPEDVIERFPKVRDAIRDQQGARLGDAMGLAAAASLATDRREQAATLWRDATTLVPAAELVRRYPELAAVASALPAVEAPS